MIQPALAPLALARVALCLVAISWVASPAAAEVWTEVRNEDGIRVEKQVDDSRVLPILRAKTTIQATPDDILAWIRDATTHTRWMANCEEAALLKEEDGINYMYNRVGAPWPVSDRDSIVRSTLVSEDGGHLVRFQNTDALGVAEKSGIVRMKHIDGGWDLRPNAAGGTDVVYRIDSDPGGSLPGWLVAQVANDVPFQTLANLRRLSESGAKR